MTMQETERFIEEVRKYPCLWNVNITTHQCRETKDAAWREVIEETGISDIEIAKDKWKKLKDAFREALKKRKKDLRLGKKVKSARPYKYHHVLEFLKPILENSGEKLDEMSNPDEDAHEVDLSSHSGHDPTAFVQVEPEIREHTPAPAICRGYKRHSSELLDFLMDDRRDESQRLVHGPDLDAMDRFFLSLSESTKKLPPSLRLQVKRKIFNAVLDAEETSIRTQYGLNGAEDDDVKPVIL